MSAHVVLNLHKFGKSDKMQCLLRILSLFCNKFNKFIKTGEFYLSYDVKIIL